MAKTNLLIEWKADFVPHDAPIRLSRVFRNIDEAITKDKVFMTNFWRGAGEEIGKIIKKKFDSGGPGWIPLVPRYIEWKENAVAKNKQIEVGVFGNRMAKFTEVGKLTGSLETSTTKPNVDANFFEVQSTPDFEGGIFRYGIHVDMIPYARKFDKKRPFFFLYSDEAQKIMKSLHKKIMQRISVLFKY